MRRLLLTIVVLTSASPAKADLTATYFNPRGIQTVVEVSDAGLVRIGASRKEEGEGLPEYSIFTPEGDFFVFYHEGQPKVVSWDVFRRVIHHNVRTMAPVPVTTAEGPILPEAEKPRTPSIPLPAPVGKVVLHSGPGTVYLGSGVNIWDRHHWIVISADAKLRPLASAFSRFFRSRIDYYQFPTYEPDPRLHELDGLMARGAPLAFGDLELDEVRFDSISPDRFKLPGKPLTAPEYQAIIGYITIGPASPNARISRPGN